MEVNKVWEGIREEGLSYGLPTTFVKLGPGAEYSTDALVKELLMHTRCKWVCILGESTTQVGMGTLVKGLSTVGMYIEVETSGEGRDPGWLHTVDRWVVDYVPDGAFNYEALRSADMIRFVVTNELDLNLVKGYYEGLKLFSGTKYIKLTGNKDSKDPLFLGEVFALTRKYERSRLYL